MIAAAQSRTATAVPIPDGLAAIRKLLPLEWVAVWQGLKPDESLHLVESGELWPAFDLSSRAVKKRKIHVWRESILTWHPGRLNTNPPPLGEIITAILPMLGLTDAAKATVRSAELQRRFCLSGLTLRRLRLAGELTAVGKVNPIRESAIISRPSIVAFLERRIVA